MLNRKNSSTQKFVSELSRLWMKWKSGGCPLTKVQEKNFRSIKIEKVFEWQNKHWSLKRDVLFVQVIFYLWQENQEWTFTSFLPLSDSDFQHGHVSRSTPHPSLSLARETSLSQSLSLTHTHRDSLSLPPFFLFIYQRGPVSLTLLFLSLFFDSVSFHMNTFLTLAHITLLAHTTPLCLHQLSHFPLRSSGLYFRSYSHERQKRGGGGLKRGRWLTLSLNSCCCTWVLPVSNLLSFPILLQVLLCSSSTFSSLPAQHSALHPVPLTNPLHFLNPQAARKQTGDR